MTVPSPAAPDYPPAERLDLVEQLPTAAPRYAVADPYRWLEDAADPRTRAWSSAQDELLAAQRATWAGRPSMAQRVRELLSAGTVGPPLWRHDRHFLVRRLGHQEHGVLLLREPDDAGGWVERVLVDPMARDPDGTTTLDAYRPSPDGELLAYQLSEGGTEESVLRVMDVTTGQDVDGPLDRTRFSPVSWLPDGQRFYYVRRLDPAGLPADEAQYHRRVWLHTVGADPATDVEVFGDGRAATTYYGTSVSRDGRWLVSPPPRAPHPATTSGSRTWRPRRPRPPRSWRSPWASTPTPVRSWVGTGGSTWRRTTRPRAAVSPSPTPDPRPRRVARPAAGARGRRPGGLRGARRAGAGRPAPARGVVDPSRRQRGHRARPVGRASPRRRRAARPRHGRRADRAPRGRARGLVHLHRPHRRCPRSTATTPAPAGSTSGRPLPAPCGCRT